MGTESLLDDYLTKVRPRRPVTTSSGSLLESPCQRRSVRAWQPWRCSRWASSDCSRRRRWRRRRPTRARWSVRSRARRRASRSRSDPRGRREGWSRRRCSISGTRSQCGVPAEGRLTCTSAMTPRFPSSAGASRTPTPTLGASLASSSTGRSAAEFPVGAHRPEASASRARTTTTTGCLNGASR